MSDSHSARPGDFATAGNSDHGPASDCEFCAAPPSGGAGGPVLWRDALCRVALVEDPHYPGFCRVILNRHVRETSDLPAAEQAALMRVVFAVEAAVRGVVRPDKLNLASLGNVTPHVHWHVIPRWTDDRHFPTPIWGAPRRESAPRPAPPDLAARLSEGLVARLGPSDADSAESPGPPRAS